MQVSSSIFAQSYVQRGNTGTSARFAVEETSLTDEQTSAIEELLAQYDVENLSSDDVEEIRQAIMEMGVQPGAELHELMTNAGVDMEQFKPDESQMAQGAGPVGSMPPPPPPMGGMMGGMVSGSKEEEDDLTTQLLEQLSSLSDEGHDALKTQLSELASSGTELSADEFAQQFADLLANLIDQYGTTGGATTLSKSYVTDLYA